MEDRVLAALRTQAWERAKGELKSILQTYYQDERFKEVDEMFNCLIKHIEDHGLVE